MTWSLAFPNLLVGLREGLEAGLVVTILIGAVRKLAPDRSLTPVWLGVASAAATSLSFGAVLTFTRAEMSPRAQEIFGGVTSLAAVVLVTTMIFWMRRAARGMAGELRARVGDALLAGGAALVVTAFVAVAREGLEAALFVWTNAQAAGSSTSPLLGALIGLFIAIALCVGLYRRVLKIDLARFFRVTGAVLIVIVAGVLAYGVRDLQDANVLPGSDNLAFDISRQVPTGSWWTELVRGVTNLDNRMSWLQVTAYLTYLVVALGLFLGRGAAAPRTPSPREPVSMASSRRRWWIASGVAVALPAAAALTWIAVDSGGPTRHAAAVAVTQTSCADSWTAPHAGARTYSVTNSSSHAVDVEIIVGETGAVAAEIEVLGPGTTRELPVTFAAGDYHWKCVYSGLPPTVSASRTVIATKDSDVIPVVAMTPATAAELAPALTRYRAFVAARLARLDRQTATLAADLRRGDIAAAKGDWLTAHLTYHRIGAAYDAFGDAGKNVDGLAQGLPGGVGDPEFTGFHRIEYGLWHSVPASQLATEARSLTKAVTVLLDSLPSFTFDPNDVTIRAHEILEDTLRFTLTGQDDYGSGSGFPTARADLDGDRALVNLLAPALRGRDSSIVTSATRDMDLLEQALDHAATAGAVGSASTAVRQRVNAATGRLLETLAPIPDLLEVRSQ